MEHTGVLEVFNTIYFVIFVLALLVSAVWSTRRIDRYLRAGQRPPILLWRDSVLMVGLVIPFGGVLLFRALGIPQHANPWWVIPSGAAAVIAMVTWAYFELVVIERLKPGEEDLWDPFARPYGEVTERPWESPSRSASDRADTPTPRPSPPPGDENEPPTWRKAR